jgi:hypothetical protein
MLDSLDEHYRAVAAALLECSVVPLLGAGVNRCNRPASWEQDKTLPDGTELATYLADYVGYPGPDRDNLLRVSQYVSVMRGSRPLYKRLHEIFDVKSPPSPVHEFFARMPAILRSQGRLEEYPLIITTNYDDALERAFRAVDEPFDLLTYRRESDTGGGRFVHYPPDEQPRSVVSANDYSDASLEERSVILKMHGAMDRADSNRDSYVITEDHYIDYLARGADISEFVPALLAEKLRDTGFLFLGCSLRDWNLRVMLHRIWGEQGRDDQYADWAVQLDPERIDERLWRARNVEILNVHLDEYVVELSRRLGESSPAPSQ